MESTNISNKKKRRFKALLGSWWYKVSTLTNKPEIGPFLSHLAGILGVLMLAGCSQLRYVPVETRVETVYRDSTVFHIDTVEVQIPREVVKEVVLTDSSYLETSVAFSTASIDSCGLLHHTLENKECALKKEVLLKERIVTRDSLVFQDRPVPVEVPVKYIPKIYKILFAIALGIVGLFVLWLISKIKKV